MLPYNPTLVESIEFAAEDNQYALVVDQLKMMLAELVKNADADENEVKDDIWHAIRMVNKPEARRAADKWVTEHGLGVNPWEWIDQPQIPFLVPPPKEWTEEMIDRAQEDGYLFDHRIEVKPFKDLTAEQKGLVAMVHFNCTLKHAAKLAGTTQKVVRQALVDFGVSSIAKAAKLKGQDTLPSCVAGTHDVGDS